MRKRRAAGPHDDGHRACQRVRAQNAAHLGARAIGQHQIQQHQIGAGCAGQAKGVAGGARRTDDVPGVAQVLLQGQADIRIVFDNQNLHPGGDHSRPKTRGVVTFSRRRRAGWRMQRRPWRFAARFQSSFLRVTRASRSSSMVPPHMMGSEERADRAGGRSDDSGRSNARTAERRVLVIAAAPDIRDLLSYTLQAGGFQVKTADTGTRGLALFETFAPDVILLDLMLPDVPGTEVCRRIRARTSGAQPAIIVLTAKGEEIDRVVGCEVGADDYVVKPFSVRELLLRVNAVLRGRSAAAGAAQGPPSGAGHATAPAGGV